MASTSHISAPDPLRAPATRFRPDDGKKIDEKLEIEIVEHESASDDQEEGNKKRQRTD